jgi:uncharacterized protein YecA (UPF0149 family)
VSDLTKINAEQRRELTATIVYSALSFGASRGTQFMGPEAAADCTLVGRIEACPCGSGQPFGACCGRRG